MRNRYAMCSTAQAVRNMPDRGLLCCKTSMRCGGLTSGMGVSRAKEAVVKVTRELERERQRAEKAEREREEARAQLEEEEDRRRGGQVRCLCAYTRSKQRPVLR